VESDIGVDIIEVPMQQSAILKVNVFETVLVGYALIDPVIMREYAPVLEESEV
jgi:hypothetical protein